VYRGSVQIDALLALPASSHRHHFDRLEGYPKSRFNTDFAMNNSTISPRTISPRQLAECCNSGRSIELIDVRTPLEYREVHAEMARNVPLDQLDPSALMLSRNGSNDEPLYVICRSGGRGHQACEKFLKAGYSNVINVEGGTTAWVEAGLGVIRGKKSISLERQVRIASGGLVLLGAGLSFIHPWFVLLSAFVGAGLIYSGVTDTCSMGMILARMPWNRCGQK
jgi:rhodanese-related sulfurtransferase